MNRIVPKRGSITQPRPQPAGTVLPVWDCSAQAWVTGNPPPELLVNTTTASGANQDSYTTAAGVDWGSGQDYTVMTFTESAGDHTGVNIYYNKENNLFFDGKKLIGVEPPEADQLLRIDDQGNITWKNKLMIATPEDKIVEISGESKELAMESKKVDGVELEPGLTIKAAEPAEPCCTPSDPCGHHKFDPDDIARYIDRDWDLGMINPWLTKELLEGTITLIVRREGFTDASVKAVLTDEGIVLLYEDD